MRLLVSVRDANEVAPALAGGADIIDAKEPDLGSLGPVAPAEVRAIVALLPAQTELSIALGDCSSTEQVSRAVHGIAVPARPVPLYLKLGFALIGSGERIAGLLAAAQMSAKKHPAAPRVIAVAYADAALAGSAEPAVIIEAAAMAGVHGVLLDTYQKGGLNLLNWFSPARLERLIGTARQQRLLTALAGGLRLEDLDTLAGLEPDVVGFRSAACRGGRAGRVSSKLVRGLRERLSSLPSGFVQ
jgi:uncharacterized protein (UPF0264 family)